MDSTGFNGAFAKLVPYNSISQALYSNTYFYVKEKDTFHLQFMNCTDEERIHSSTDPVESSTEYETDHEADPKGSGPDGVTQLGHFVLSFDRQRLPEMPHLGWRVGRGASKISANRGVDFMLAPPRDKLGKSLASIHFIFRFNRQSGFLMLKGGSPKVPVEYSKNGVWEKLEFDKEQLMYQSSTILRAGLCQYQLKYTVEEKHRVAYFEQRAVFLQPRDQDFQDPVFEKLPGDKCMQRGKYLEFGTKGSGAFGWITQGVDTETGDPVAIKEVRITKDWMGVEIMNEVTMGRRFADERGLLPTLDAVCEHGHHRPCCKLEKFYIFMPHAQSDLSVSFWSDGKIPRKHKLAWLREPLEGIRTLHKMGIMHRDIKPQNMLIMSSVPPRASLCDYGKAKEGQTSTYTKIGPIPTLAPEVWAVDKKGPYTDKIDLWAYGWAIAQILMYALQNSKAREYFSANYRITPTRHLELLQLLQFDCREKSEEDGPLIDLLFKLLVWNPEERWSAEQALQHVCWSPITQQEGKKDVVGETGGTKRSAASVDDSKSPDKQAKDVEEGKATVDEEEYSTVDAEEKSTDVKEEKSKEEKK